MTDIAARAAERIWNDANHTGPCCEEMARIIDEEIAELKDRLEIRTERLETLEDDMKQELQKTVAGLRGQVAELRAENERLSRIHLDMHQSEGGWIWQGDGEDHLESLSCPVVIPAAELKHIVDENERLQLMVINRLGPEDMKGDR